MVQEGTIESIDVAEWAVPIVPVLKQDKLCVRICGHFRLTVNLLSKLDSYPILKIEDLLAMLTKEKIVLENQLESNIPAITIKGGFTEVCGDQHPKRVVPVYLVAIWHFISARNFSDGNKDNTVRNSKCSSLPWQHIDYWEVQRRTSVNP